MSGRLTAESRERKCNLYKKRKEDEEKDTLPTLADSRGNVTTGCLGSTAERFSSTYRFDLFTVRKDSEQEQKWIVFFSRVNLKWCESFGWDREAKKGLVRVSI